MVVRIRPFLVRWAVVLLVWASMVPAQAATGVIPAVAPTQVAGPTLARLSFWVPPERRDEFAAEYEASIAPRLRTIGLVPASQPGRPAIDSVFSRLFVLPSSNGFANQARILTNDTTLRDLRRLLGARFDTAGPDSLLRWSFGLYRDRVQPAQVTRLGPGRGRWRTYGVKDGLYNVSIGNMLQDRDGYLWFGSDGGAFRYDGRSSMVLTKADGLAGNHVLAVLQAADGRLWFGTTAGVSCYDGSRVTSYTRAQGLAADTVFAIAQTAEGDLWFGTWGSGVSRFDGRTFVTHTVDDGLAGNGVLALVAARDGSLWLGTDKGLSRFDGRSFTRYTTRQYLASPAEESQGVMAVKLGLGAGTVTAAYQDRHGYLWFGTLGGGVSRFDAAGFVTWTTRQGLVSNVVSAIAQDQAGNLWFGTDAGVSRFDGQRFETFTTDSGLAGNIVGRIVEDADGYLWFGTNAGLSRYDARTMATYTTADGLPSNEIYSAVADAQGRLWLTCRNGTFCGLDGGTVNSYGPPGGAGPGYFRMATTQVLDPQGMLWGVSADSAGGPTRLVRFDGESVDLFAAEDGMPAGVTALTSDRQGGLWLAGKSGVHHFDGASFTPITGGAQVTAGWIMSLAQDQQGQLWLANWGRGASWYDGQTFHTLTTADGLSSNDVWAVHPDRQGNVWLGTYGGGLCRYDGQGFTTFSEEDGLLSRFLMQGTLEDRQGHLWFTTDGGGVTRYDGQVFQSLSQEDGLAGDVVRAIAQDPAGDYWFACSGGLTRYHPPVAAHPAAVLDQVVAGGRYRPGPELSFSSSVGLIAFEFHGVSLKTRPGGMVFRYRLAGHEQAWHTTTRSRVEYPGVGPGDYIFQVMAVDRDLGYSDAPAEVALSVHRPRGPAALAAGLVAGVLAAVGASAYGLRKRRQARLVEQRLFAEMARELQTAHELQMGLLPKHGPGVPGYQIAGRCLPANHVGGDFYQYFPLPQGRLALCMADVTGHAMEAAIPAVMVDGILDSQMRIGSELENLFSRLNRVLCEKLTGRTHVAFSMVQLDPATLTGQFANAGCPYPCHYRQATREVVELALDAYPLGVRPDTVYQTTEARLEAGDYLVFYSDGIAEAADAAGELFGFSRTVAMVREACGQGLPPEGVIDHLVAAVQGFCGEAAQGDDITCVVVRMEG